MRTYISDIIPKIQRFSQKLDNIALLTNQHWVVIDEIDNIKNTYIFRQNNELLISQNGRVEKAKWEFLGHNSILIDRKNESYLFKHSFFDENILALKIDSKDEYAFLVNEIKFNQELNSASSVMDFLNRIYIEPQAMIKIEESTGLGSNKRLSHKENNTYVAPNHEIRKVGENCSVCGKVTEHYVVEYDDGVQGALYLEQGKKYYFKGRKSTQWMTYKYYYENTECCINALHYFLKNEWN